MDYFIDIRILPDPELNTQILLNALFSKFHRAVVAHGFGEIGVSFPEYNKDLGNILRLHGSKDNLSGFLDSNWIKGLRDYTRVGELAAVPVKCRYRTVKRIRPKMSAARQRRLDARRAARGDQGIKAKATNEECFLRLHHPFIRLISQSSGQVFPLFIQHGDLLDSATQGNFSAYGLSDTATIPWF